MRISDWSSDVCSSDLALAIDRECGNDDDHLGQGIVIRDGHVNLRLHTRWRHFRQALSGSPRQRHGRLAARTVDSPEVAPVDSQLGRAACRERGGKYVELPVDAGTLKKTTKNKN